MQDGEGGRGARRGIFGAATSAGQLVFVWLLVDLTTRIGWRNSILALGTLAALLIISVAQRSGA